MCSGSTCVYSTCVCAVQRRMQRSQCCRCNGSATCAQCSCRKDGRSCTGCLPSRKNRCKNSPPSSHPTRDQAKRAELSQNSTGIRCRTTASVVNVCLELNASDEDASVDALLEACRLESSHDTPSVTESAVITTADPARTGAKDASTAGLPTSSKEHAWDLLEQHHDAQSTAAEEEADAAKLLVTSGNDSLHNDTELLANLAGSQSADMSSTPGSSPVQGQAPPPLHDDLPTYIQAMKTGFALGTMSEAESEAAINAAHDEAVHFRSNAFNPPRGSVGKAFILQLSRYLACFGNAATFEGIALKVAMVFQQLMLQNPHAQDFHSLSAVLR